MTLKLNHPSGDGQHRTRKKIIIKRPVTCGRIFITLKLTTIKRLEAEVEKGSRSALIDMAINDYLDKAK